MVVVGGVVKSAVVVSVVACVVVTVVTGVVVEVVDGSTVVASYEQTN